MANNARDDRRGLWDGFGKGMHTALELAIVPLVFGLLGGLADRTFGTGPIWTVTLVVFAFVGLFVKIWYEYLAHIAAEEKDKPWTRSR